VLLCDRTDKRAERFAPAIVFSVGRLGRGYRTRRDADNPAIGGLGRGDTKVKQLRTLLRRALVGALLLVALCSSIASADPGVPAPEVVAGTTQAVLPEDPGIEYAPHVLPEDPGIN
jgi:hypothetical protein